MSQLYKNVTSKVRHVHNIVHYICAHKCMTSKGIKDIKCDKCTSIV